MTKKIKIRTLLLGGIFTLFFMAMVTRIYWVQVVDARDLVGMAQGIWEKDEVLRAQRGAIVDRNGHVLAEDGPAYTVVVDPYFIDAKKKRSEVVKGLSAILGKPEPEVDALVGKRKEDGSYFRWVEVRSEGWKIDGNLADQIKEQFKPFTSYNNLIHMYNYGIYLEEGHKRYYPSGRMASHLLGYYDKQDQAVMGLEAKYDEVLRGTPGKMLTEKDRRGNELPNAKVSLDPAVDGKTLKLTIDKQIQSYIESAIEQSYQRWKPKNISVIAADPKTGEILGMATAPNFNPNQYWEFESQSDFYNHAIGSQYEPGSTFKLVTLAAAIQEGVFRPNDMFQSGGIKVPGAVLHDHEYNGWGRISYLDGLKRSSNVAFVKLGYEMLGEQKLRDYIERFGFGTRTDVDMPGEAKGLIRFRWPSEVATATYGQGGVLVTTVQQIAAFGAIANGGRMMWPHVIKEIIDPDTGTAEKVEPRMVREVVQESTARQVSEYLEQVVSDQKIGTGRRAYIDGYRVAGKTGTANVVVGGKYASDRWLVSFIGYAPVEDPRIVIAVVADQPDLKGNYHLGGEVTIPVFREIMSQSLRYMGITENEKGPAIEQRNVSVTIPDLSGMNVSAVKGELDRREIAFDILGSGARVVAQFPEAGTQTGPLQRMYVLTQERSQIKTPNLQGKPLRDALELCSLLGVACRTSGEGYVVSQTELADGALSLALEPQSPDETASGEPPDGIASAEKTDVQTEADAPKDPPKGTERR